MKLNDIIKTIGFFFTRMDKSLYKGTTWQSGSIAISGISKYSVFYIKTNAANGIGYRDGNNIVMQSGMAINSASLAWSTTMILVLSGDVATITQNYNMQHIPSNSHGSVIGTAVIQEIVGLLPKVGGGGVLKCTYFNGSRDIKGVAIWLLGLIIYLNILPTTLLSKVELEMYGHIKNTQTVPSRLSVKGMSQALLRVYIFRQIYILRIMLSIYHLQLKQLHMLMDIAVLELVLVGLYILMLQQRKSILLKSQVIKEAVQFPITLFAITSELKVLGNNGQGVSL